ncbi:thymidine kinase [Elysia marginata]|uniref:Thymidine kinase n=1 Tax=Elysia marginata TaxID=1093978 RepID=A0AAV4H012_9GAST|nr:thymidine kinase [Elysia marginata]
MFLSPARAKVWLLRSDKSLAAWRALGARLRANRQMAGSATTKTLGYVEFFLGPMFSEKTTEVGRRIKRARLGGLNCVFVKNAADVRYGAGPVIHTHDGGSFSTSPATGSLGRLRVVEAHNLLDVELSPDELVIGVDEGQFYSDLRRALDFWTQEGRQVYVAALDGDFRRNVFPPVAEAFPLASRIVKLTAVCMLCAGRGRSRPIEAPYTLRTVEDTTVKLIGALDKYKAACPACYLDYHKTANISGADSA